MIIKQMIPKFEDPKQSIVNYFNSVNTVTNYAVSINGTLLPVLVICPVDYGDFVNTFGAAKIHVQGWLKEVIPSFNIIPDSLLNFDTIIQNQFSIIENNLNLFKNDPSNLTIIKSTANDALNEITVCKKTITSVIASINKFQQTISSDANQLNNLAVRLTKEVKVDQIEIQKLDKAIANLQSIIDSRKKLATLNTLANFDECIFVAIASLSIGIGFAEAGNIVIGIIGAGATTYIPIHVDIEYEQSLADLQKEIENVTTEIGSVNSTIGLLQQIATQFTSINIKSGDICQNIDLILTFWGKHDAKLNEILTDLKNIIDSLSDQSKIDDAVIDITNAKNCWNYIIDYMRNLNTKFNYVLN